MKEKYWNRQSDLDIHISLLNKLLRLLNYIFSRIISSASYRKVWSAWLPHGKTAAMTTTFKNVCEQDFCNVSWKKKKKIKFKLRLKHRTWELHFYSQQDFHRSIETDSRIVIKLLPLPWKSLKINGEKGELEGRDKQWFSESKVLFVYFLITLRQLVLSNDVVIKVVNVLLCMLYAKGN